MSSGSAGASSRRPNTTRTDSDRFDIHRPDKAQLALGHGPHYCLGAWLARMEIGIALGTLIERFPELQLAVSYGQLEWRESFRSHALRRLPVSVG
ncbi:cytochrome P450 [Streptomyces noursei]|uniref:cytochrome P450 n=1 Tax=Streptomyces noursei TaxID=1971 RepID=UPI0037A06FDC